MSAPPLHGPPAGPAAERRTVPGTGPWSSSTTARFAVLVMLMLTVTAGIGSLWRDASQPWLDEGSACHRTLVAIRYELIGDHQRQAMLDGLASPVRTPWAPTSGVGSPAEQTTWLLLLPTLTRDELRRRQPDCFRTPLPFGDRLEYALPAAVAAAGLLLYGLMPHWRIRSRRLLPLAQVAPTEVTAEVRSMAAAAGVRARFLVHPLDPRVDGVAFGHVGRRYVALNRGVLRLHRVDPDGFRAVVAHELGHLHNRDVDLGGLTVALWYAYLLVVVTPTLFLVPDWTGTEDLFFGTRSASLGAWLHMAALTAVIYLARNGVLQTREIYADRFAAAAYGQPLEQLLRRAVAEHDAPVGWNADEALPDARTRRGPGHLWRRLVRVHPAPADRYLALQHDQYRFEFSPGGMFALSVAVMLVLPVWLNETSVQIKKILLARGDLAVERIWSEAMSVYPALAVLITVPLGAGLAVGVTRIAATAPRREAVRHALALALALAAGLVVGELVTPADTRLAPLTPYADGWRWPLLVAASALASVLLLLLTAWSWHRTTRGRRPRPASILVAAHGAILITLWLPGLIAARYTSLGTRDTSISLPALADLAVAWLPDGLTGFAVLALAALPAAGLVAPLAAAAAARGRSSPVIGPPHPPEGSSRCRRGGCQGCRAGR
ncbi:M48 family metallopeptidase [Nucisporomicrobium flavum]|uniref:M48 family metallopeptidase n=1 Tax=Nucisporomicrobium flavum TaxID=2785915 RepID=UPI003C2C659D